MHNLRKQRSLRDLLKEMRGCVEQGQIDRAKTLLPKVQKALDKATKTGLIKKNTAQRRKSMLARAVNPKQ